MNLFISGYVLSYDPRLQASQCPVPLNLNPYISHARASPDFNSAARALGVLFCLIYIFSNLPCLKGGDEQE